MWQHSQLNKYQLHALIKGRQITFAGNSKLKIYGHLNCFSGRRMHRQQRVFFVDESEAVAMDFRPCGHCLKHKYKQWKANCADFQK